MIILADIKDAEGSTDSTYSIHPPFAIFTNFKPVLTNRATGTGTNCSALT